MARSLDRAAHGPLPRRQEALPSLSTAGLTAWQGMRGQQGWKGLAGLLAPSNKGMKQTRSAPAREPRPLQLIPSVVRT
jgi:hypothetical protein